MLRAALTKGLVHQRLDYAFRLAAYRRQLAYHEVPGAFEHSLLAERERLAHRQVGEILQNLGDVKDVPSLHPFKEFLISVFPIDGGIREVRREGFQQPVALIVVDWRPQADFYCIGDRNHNSGFSRFQPKQVETILHACNFGSGNLLDYAYAVIRIDNFLAYFEAHRYLLVIVRAEPCLGERT